MAKASLVFLSHKGAEGIPLKSTLVFLQIQGVKYFGCLEAKIVTVLLQKIMGYDDLVK